jgi:type I restriction enzyme, S subunit
MRHATVPFSTILAETRRPLPPDWRRARLGDLCHLIIGRTPRREMAAYWGGDLPWVTISDLNGGVVTQTRECITHLGAEHSRARLLKAGTLLFSFKLTIGKVAIAGMDLYTNEAIAGLIPHSDDEVDRDYLRLALASIDVGARSSHAVKGRTLNQETLAALEIPIPSISEQRRIATALAGEIDTVERARAAAEAQLEAAKALPAAYVRAVFAGDEAARWRKRLLGEVCELNGQYGTSVKSNGVGQGVPILGMGNILDGQIMWDRVRHVVLAEDDVKKYLLRPGDLLFNRTNSAELVGKTAVFRGDREAVFASYLIRFKPKRDLIVPGFLCAFINSEMGREFVRRHMARAIGQVNISASTMHGMPVPVPGISEQEHIVASLHDQVEGARAIETAIESRLAAVDALPAGLLRRAFSGEL